MSSLDNTPVSALLELASSQLEVAAHTADSQVETLAASIAALVTLSTELQAVSGAAPAALSRKIAEQAQNALMSMQFHDQLVQRIAHVRDTLTELNEALRGPAGEVDWATVLAAIRCRYSMEDERMLFDRLIGAFACPAVKGHESIHDSLRGSVDLF